jgi:hypothetical protein
MEFKFDISDEQIKNVIPDGIEINDQNRDILVHSIVRNVFNGKLKFNSSSFCAVFDCYVEDGD